VYCPQCRNEYNPEIVECPQCGLPLVDDPQAVDSDKTQNVTESEADLDALIRTGLSDPIAVGLAKSLLEEAGIPYFDMDQNSAARQESGNWLNWWTVRVPKERHAEALEILMSIAPLP
jgi:hypothetical protein